MSDLPDDATPLIAASRISGTAVYNRQDEKLGTVEDLMLDPVTGMVGYAVLSFGGFLGLGNRHHPLPWSSLAYDAARGVYVVDIDRSALQEAPSYDPEDISAWEDPTYGRQLSDYYGRPKL
jgi:hypothetical protein